MNRRELLQTDAFEAKEYSQSIVFQNEGEKWAWLAGIVDGEGCFSLSRGTATKRGYMVLRIDNKNHELMRFLTMTFGGSYSEVKKKGRIYYQYALSMTGLRQVLPKIRPYLIVKAEEADIVQQVLKAMKYRGDTTEFMESMQKGLESLHSEKSAAGKKGGRKRKS